MLLEYSEQKNKHPYSEMMADVFAGIFLAAGVFACLCSAFGLRWTPALALSGTPAEGLLSACNRIADHLGERDYIILNRFAGGVGEGGSPEPQGLFLTIMLVALALLCCMIVRSRVRLLLLIPTVPLIACMMFTQTHPGIWAGIAFVAALTCALIVMMPETVTPWAMIMPLTAVMMALAIGVATDQGGAAGLEKIQKSTGETLREIADKRYGSNPLGSGRLDELEGKELKSARGKMENPTEQLSRNDLTKTALEITMEDPVATYLKGFAGEKYEKGGRWSEMDTAVYYRQRDQLYRLNERGFDGLSQLNAAAQAAEGLFGGAQVAGGEMGSGGAASQIDIRVKGADKSRIYAPYELIGTDRDLPDGMQNYAGGFLKSDRVMGTGKYTWSIRKDTTDKWTDLAGKLYSAEETESLKSYFDSESHYNVWCYEHYTEIPDDIRTLLDAAMGTPPDLSKTHGDYKEAITTIRDYLDGNFVYTDDFPKPGANEDPVEQFLLTGKGCDAHYASLASLLFRWFGIPSRYVEGYLVTPGDTENAKATEAISINASHAHAWTEIYVDGVGWVPIEVTTAYKGLMPEADMERGLEAIAYENLPKKQEDERVDESPVKAKSNIYSRKMLRILLIVISLLLLLLLAWILSRVIRKILVKRARQRSFADPDPRRGICAMYGYLLQENIPCSKYAIEIGDFAAFSNNLVDERHRSMMYKEMEWGENEKRIVEKNNRRSPADRIFDLWNSLRGK